MIIFFIVVPILIILFGQVIAVMLEANTGEIASIFGLSLICTLIVAAVIGFGAESRYKQGQIDAITGHIYYAPITKEDLTTSWEYFDEENDTLTIDILWNRRQDLINDLDSLNKAIIVKHFRYVELHKRMIEGIKGIEEYVDSVNTKKLNEWIKNDTIMKDP